MSDELCMCGSGKRFVRCHGDPSNAFARDQALAEARQIALLFPSVRLRAPSALALADRLAQELGDAEELDESHLDIALVDERERRRLVEEWSASYPDRWASLRHAASDVDRAEGELVRGALVAEVHERLPTPRELLVELELLAPSPAVALAFLLPPQFVWSLDEARAAAAALPERIDEVAAALGRVEHLDRLKGLARRVREELPFDGFPTAAQTVAEACSLAETSIDFARGVVTLSLIAYARELSLVASAN